MLDIFLSLLLAVISFSLIVLSVVLIPIFTQVFRRRGERRMEITQQPAREDKSDIAKAIPFLETSSSKACVKVTDEMARVAGNMNVPEGHEIKENMVIHGNLTLGSKCRVYGNLSVFGEVEIGEDSIVDGHILAEGRISIARNGKVTGVVDSAEDIILRENVTAEAVSTEKSVILEPGAKVNRRVVCGESLRAKPSLVKRLETELPAKEARQPTALPFDTFFKEKETEETKSEKNRLFKTLQEQVERLDSYRKREIDESVLEKLALKEAKVYKLTVSGRDVDEIGLRLLIDPVEVQEILDSLIDRHYLDEHLRSVKVENGAKVAEGVSS